ncbi:MAG: hypothetical protein QNJ69_14105 [Gammaproteobacteria bacterium]|nr:hypothetical protein [Gammaproteobacteria bacterium]
MPANLFTSSQHFKQHFIRQLTTMLQHDEIGVFILVLANASMLAEIRQQLQPALEERFQQLCQRLDRAPASELESLPADDIDVFRQLQATGFTNLQLSRHRKLEPWQLHYNQLRSFRPPRNSGKNNIALYQAFDEQAFHFNKPFLRREILWQGELAGIPMRLMYNKFPFADYHGILLLRPEQQKPQYLQAEDCADIQRLLARLNGLTELGLAYNSLGAHASVNHQHWQWFLAETAYPVELAAWSHNGGGQRYPLEVRRFASLVEAWPLIEQYQREQQAFNLFCRHASIYVVRRKAQGQSTASDWNGGFAWSEIMGRITLGNSEDFARIRNADIAAEFARLRC